MADAGSSLTVSDQQMDALEKACGGSTVVACPKVTVAIELPQPVACPGHPLPIAASGSPAGGTYAWSVSGAELVDDSGRSSKSGASVNLRSFQPDESGRIPEIKAKVSVKYTHPNGTASASRDVTVHKIDFEVAGDKPVVFPLQVKEGMNDVSIGNRSESVPTMNVEPKVTLKLGAACPRKQECASNHRVGWLQDVTRWEKSFRFRRRLVQLRTPVGPPIRDAESGAPFPFYSESSTFDFKDDADFYRVNHSDSPAFGALWEDSKDPHPSSSPLEQVIFKLGFTAWLVVQNIEWSSRDVPGSLVYLGNFDWSLDCTLNVTTAPPARRTTEPQVFTPQITASGKGKGSRTPSFTPESANESVKTDVTDLSVPAGDRKAPRPSPHR